MLKNPTPTLVNPLCQKEKRPFTWYIEFTNVKHSTQKLNK